jgi:GntR family transcriptional regulator, rspAB operon transcriptional repressor
MGRDRKIFETVRDRIVHGEYGPGTNLPEKELCKEFGISRTPLREAILRLREMKLLNVIPRFGTMVTPIDINEVRSAFEVKTKLEGLVGELSAARISSKDLDRIEELINKAENIPADDTKRRHRDLIETDALFHEILYQAAQNPLLQEFLENLHSRCARLWSSSLSQIVPSGEIAGQLRDVYLALKEKDSGKAGRLMEVHVQYYVDKIKTLLL